MAMFGLFKKKEKAEEKPVSAQAEEMRVFAGQFLSEEMEILVLTGAGGFISGKTEGDELHTAGKDHEIPYKGMMLTTVVARAARMVRLENGPDAFEMPLSAIAIGPVAMLGLPGEPFTGVGRGLKEAEGWELILPTCNTNAKEGYFPMLECYEEGGYEAGSSNFKAGVAELLIEAGISMLNSLKG